MKTTVSTFVIFVLAVVLNIGSLFARNNESVYRNEVMDEATNTQTITVCKGNEGTDLVPVKKYTIQYNEANIPVEKTVYKYDNTDWIPSQKYIYAYNESGEMQNLTLLNWNTTQKTWERQ